MLNPIEAEPDAENKFMGTAHLKTEVGTGGVICLESDLMPVDKKNWYVPAWVI